MSTASRKISRALISVFYKDQLEPIIHFLGKNKVEFLSTGGTQEFIEKLGYVVTPVEKLTGYPSIFGGRVKTLHPAIFGGILFRRDEPADVQQASTHAIPAVDLVIVDLYPFEETVAAAGTLPEEIIEKIDIGGIALIRAAAKNFKDVLVVSSRDQYGDLLALLQSGGCTSELEERKLFATRAFDTTSHYDTAIFKYFNKEEALPRFKASIRTASSLRYGENPHQKGTFYGDLAEIMEQLHGKELSYNNLVDVDSALGLISEFKGEIGFVIIKHTNACGVATGSSVPDAYRKAYAADPVSAFGGVLASNSPVDLEAAEEMNRLFFEILVAPGFSEEALDLLKSKKNRILLRYKKDFHISKQVKSLLNGILEQDTDWKTDSETDFRVVTNRSPSPAEIRAMVFASKVCKHTKSNTIVLAEDGRLLASGVGQTSRVDALKQAVEKAKSFGFALDHAVMASDAFFPFPDCVEIASRHGIRAVVQPGGSVKDQDSIDYCNKHNMAMVFTGFRHFKH